jgi:hypothetical protein
MVVQNKITTDDTGLQGPYIVYTGGTTTNWTANIKLP